ncbi:hypothetical protein GDO86_000906, partial [Hymenochirus boettgeri]
KTNVLHYVIVQQLQTISVVCVAKGFFNSFPCVFPLTTISISVEFTNITSLCNGSLSALPFLKELHLSSNALHSLPNHFPHPLSHLHTIDLTNNFIKSVSPTLFLDTPALRSLVLKGNLLSKLWVSKVPILERLEWLDLSENNITTLNPLSFYSFHNLENIDLSYNQIQELPPSLLKAFPLLQRLNLEGNNLTSLPSSVFTGTPFLKHVYLGKNSLHFLPERLFLPIISLKTLDLSDNQLSRLPPGLLQEARGLGEKMEQSLDLSYNPWHCDCHLLSMHLWVSKHISSFYSINNTKCAKPATLENYTLYQVTQTELC